MLALIAGLPALSIVSVRDGAFTDYHLPTDIPERVDWDSVAACTRLAAGIAEEWDASGRTGARGHRQASIFLMAVGAIGSTTRSRRRCRRVGARDRRPDSDGGRRGRRS